jgi:putative two-component system protein, hydrogenase maturation factor HypX/HoxX
MRILFLARSFNSLTQRLYLELTALGHEVSVELDIADAVTIEAVALFRPALIVAPFLKRAIPAAVWQHTPCLVVHPGIVGDRGPSALDWAVMNGVRQWGVTVLQAEAEMDAGPVWASETFAMRDASKSSLYRREVTEAATRALLRAVRRFEAGAGPDGRFDTCRASGRFRPLMRQADRHIDWQQDGMHSVVRKVRAADGTPGVLDRLFGVPCHLFDAHTQALVHAQPPGQVIGRRHGALQCATIDGSVWIGHVRRVDGPDGADAADSLKLPATLAFATEAASLPELPVDIDAAPGSGGWHDIRLERHGDVGVLHFDFYNGAMSTEQCKRLDAAVGAALAQPDRVLLLLGGPDFWSNGLHLNVIEAADSPADESWRNINAMNDLTLRLIEATDRLVVAALQGNAGAGGVFMALAADQTWARHGVVLNPHYRNMGNLYGSEYWTYLLPRRLKGGTVEDVMGPRLPMAASQAQRLGLIDAVFGDHPDGFVAQARARAEALAASQQLPVLLQAKRQRRQADEALKPLATYRAEELAHMRRNFYGFDPSYHIARSNFVRRVAPSWTPRHLSLHRHGASPGSARPGPQGCPAASGSTQRAQDRSSCMLAASPDPQPTEPT